MTGTSPIVITEATRGDGAAIAALHLASRAHAMAYLRRVHSDAETLAYFTRVVADRPLTWWVIRREDQVASFMHADGEALDHLYVLPRWQGHGLGSALLAWAKRQSPGRLRLWTFQRNTRARAFYEARGFHAVRSTEGDNEEREPDLLYEWRAKA